MLALVSVQFRSAMGFIRLGFIYIYIDIFALLRLALFVQVYFPVVRVYKSTMQAHVSGD